MNGRSHGEHAFEFEDRPANVVLEAETEDLEQRLQIEHDGEQRLEKEFDERGNASRSLYLDFVIEFAISSVDRFVVRVFNRGGEDRIGQHEDHHHRGENWRLNNFQADRRRHARAFIVVDVH